ncbi:MAG: acyl-CoA desaturase, partial [Deltaproteobacteria bacterium]|nr:acyl-CoA desaturase [Deltaproteobacteria bacterium]
MSKHAVLGDLRARLIEAGVFETRERQSWIKLAVLAAGVATCLTLVAELGWIAGLVLLPIAGALSTSIAMFGHEGSHRSFSKSPRRNALLLYLVFPLFGGLGAMYWRDKHDRRHHAHPNVEDLDPDLTPFPFASSRRGHESAGAFTRWFQRTFQRWLFWPMATLMAIGMRRSSLLYLARQPRDRDWYIEAACLAAHYIGWLVVPALIWGPLVTLAIYAGMWGATGVCLALVFAPAHMGLPIVAKPSHDWRHQLATTRNLELPRAISWLFIGLDYQSEHHLFPKIPHANLPLAARITSAWCAEHGVEYHSEPYLAAFGSARRFIARAWAADAETYDAEHTGPTGNTIA